MWTVEVLHPTEFPRSANKPINKTANKYYKHLIQSIFILLYIYIHINYIYLIYIYIYKMSEATMQSERAAVKLLGGEKPYSMFSRHYNRLVNLEVRQMCIGYIR